MVVASGNNGSDRLREYPAAESAYGQLSIGASTAAHRRATFSNFGSWVDLAAPGEAITSTFAGGTYATWSGTSMAAPLASGTAALLRSRFPTMPTKDLARRIDRTTVNLCGGTDLRELDAIGVAPWRMSFGLLSKSKPTSPATEFATRLRAVCVPEVSTAL
jgi:subtilisin family serine protease